jgi:IMP and pyridine-specific 5'-nucleotidase
MSFSSRRRNYLLTPHRRDGLIEWMKSMLQHSFVLDALETTAADTFLHFEVLIEEHRAVEKEQLEYRNMMQGHHQPGTGHLRNTSNVPIQQSRLKQLVPTIGTFHTPLPLRDAFEIYNEKHRLVRIHLFVMITLFGCR